MSMKFVKKIKIISIWNLFRPIHDLRGKKKKQKTRKPNLIRSEEKNDIKDKFLDSGARSKEGRRQEQTRNSSSEKERGEITHHPH